MKTGALEHSFGGEGAARKTTAWSPCGTKLLSCCSKGLQVWDIATGVVVHEWGHIVHCGSVMVVVGDKVATFDDIPDITVWDYTTGVEVFVRTCPSALEYVALSPNERFVAACCTDSVHVWNVETGEGVFEDLSENKWTDVAVSNDIVAACCRYTSDVLVLWSISTGEQLLNREIVEFDDGDSSYGLAISRCGGVVMYGGGEGVEIVDISHLS